MDVSHDPCLLRVLEELRIDSGSLLGYGGEACVFAYGDGEIVRIHHAGVDRAAVEARSALLDELRSHHGCLPFAIPFVVELRVIAGRFVTFEPRLRGRTLAQALGDIRGPARGELIVATLEASRALGRVPISRPWFGDLCQRRRGSCT